MLNKSDWYYYGNALFINNSVSVQNESSLSNLVGGGAVYCANSMLFSYGYTLFQYNRATAPLDVHSPIQTRGGAISAFSSKVIFANTSGTIFMENNSSHLGGAISISTDSNLTIIRGARSTFLKNCALYGGAIEIRQSFARCIIRVYK